MDIKEAAFIVNPVVSDILTPDRLKTLKMLIWNDVEMPIECNEKGCPGLRITQDVFGTGDSPADYDCKWSPGECPVVCDALEGDIEELMEHYF